MLIDTNSAIQKLLQDMWQNFILLVCVKPMLKIQSEKLLVLIEIWKFKLWLVNICVKSYWSWPKVAGLWFWRIDLKQRSDMRGGFAEQRQVDFDIPALLPWVCSHIRGFKEDAENWVLGPFLNEQILPCSATAHVWSHVMIFVEANFLPAFSHVCSAHVWTYHKFLTLCSTAKCG